MKYVKFFEIFEAETLAKGLTNRGAQVAKEKADEAIERLLGAKIGGTAPYWHLGRLVSAFEYLKSDKSDADNTYALRQVREYLKSYPKEFLQHWGLDSASEETLENFSKTKLAALKAAIDDAKAIEVDPSRD